MHVLRDESKVVFHRCASKEVALAHANHTICLCALFGSELESIGAQSRTVLTSTHVLFEAHPRPFFLFFLLLFTDCLWKFVFI